MAEECMQRHQCCQFPMGESFDVTLPIQSICSTFCPFLVQFLF